MRADQRHQLKTNELAEWLSNLPQWAKENRSTIITAVLVIAAGAAFYFWRTYNKNAVIQEQLQLTNLIGQIFGGKVQALQDQQQGTDTSFILLQPADKLEIFAQNVDDHQMAAFALIKRAEALRTELHYRLSTPSRRELELAISQAKACYTEALQRCSNNPSLMALAKFGLGLCEEELGNLDKAKQIYREIAANPDFQYTVAAAQAKQRLETVDDYRQKIVFMPAPKPTLTKPALEPNKPADTNLRSPAARLAVDTNLPTDINLGPQAPNAAVRVIDANAGPIAGNDVIEVPGLPQGEVPDNHQRQAAANDLSQASDVNLPHK